MRQIASQQMLDKKNELLQLKWSMGVNELLASWDLVFDLLGGKGLGAAGVPLQIMLGQPMVHNGELGSCDFI